MGLARQVDSGPPRGTPSLSCPTIPAASHRSAPLLVQVVPHAVASWAQVRCIAPSHISTGMVLGLPRSIQGPSRPFQPALVPTVAPPGLLKPISPLGCIS